MPASRWRDPRFWFGEESGAAYERRRASGTRLPIYRDARDLRLISPLIVVIASPLLGVKAIAGGNALGWVLLTLGLVGVVLLIRYLRRPVDPNEAPPPKAPTSSSTSTVLEVPASYAFDFLADPSTARIIDPMVREYRPDTPVMGLGTRNVLRLRVWGVPVRSMSVVEAWEPGVVMRMVSTRPIRPVKVRAEHRFERLGPERCRYTWTISCEPTMPGGRIVARLFGRFLAANADAQRVRFATEVRRRWDRAVNR